MIKFSKSLKVLVTTLLLVSTLGSQVLAAESGGLQSNVEELDAIIYEYVNDSGISTCETLFYDASITFAYYSDTGLDAMILTSVNGVASVVGVKDIKIQAKNGNSWVTVATSAGGELTNAQGMGCRVTYSGVIEGVTYRVVCTHYADYEGYRELYHESGGLVCQYND